MGWHGRCEVPGSAQSQLPGQAGRGTGLSPRQQLFQRPQGERECQTRASKLRMWVKARAGGEQNSGAGVTPSHTQWHPTAAHARPHVHPATPFHLPTPVSERLGGPGGTALWKVCALSKLRKS